MPQDRFVTRVVALAVSAVLVYVLYLIFRPFIGSIVWALLLAYLLFPLVMRLRRRLGGRPSLAAAIMTVGVILGFGVPFALITAAFAGQAVELVQRLSQMAQQYQIQAPEDLVALPLVGKAVEWLDAILPVSAAQIQTWAVRALQTVLQFLLAHTGAFVAGAFGIVGNISVMLFVLFFFFRDGDEMLERAFRLVPMDPKRKDRLRRHLGDVTRAVVFGTIVTALAQGMLIGIAFWICGMTSPVVFGGLAFIASFIPFVGTSLVVAARGPLPPGAGGRVEMDFHARLGRPGRGQRRQLPPAGARVGAGRDRNADRVLRRGRRDLGVRPGRPLPRPGGPGARPGPPPVRRGDAEDRGPGRGSAAALAGG